MNDCCRAGSTDKLEKMITPTNQLLSLLLLFFPSQPGVTRCALRFFDFFFFFACIKPETQLAFLWQEMRFELDWNRVWMFCFVREH